MHPTLADIFTAAENLTKEIAAPVVLVLFLVVGIKALGKVLEEKHGGAVILALAALIPAIFLLDPSGAKTLYESTVGKILH